jgi:hypothetical protein
MPRRVNGKLSSDGSYQTQLRRAMSRHLPKKGLPTLSDDGRVRWVPRLLVFCAILMAWDTNSTLVDRFTAARDCVVRMFPTRRRPGSTFTGFIAALAKAGDDLLCAVTAALRKSGQSLAESQGWWTTRGWVVFGGDGSKIDCPMTEANEKGLGLGCKKVSWPQMLLTTLFHVGTGLPWGFVRGGGRECERSHLISMFKLLPKGSLLTADAGFPGYDLFKAAADAGVEILIRVGGNVKLLTKLGWHVKEFDGLVYLWPDAKQKKGMKPLVLRLIKVKDGRNNLVCLVTSVLETQRLSDDDAIAIYKKRWLVELLFRSLKQTMGRRKMLGDSPDTARSELDWSMVGLWLLALMTAEAAGTTERLAIAPALRAVRHAATNRGRNLRRSLARAVGDRYERKGSKKARHWPKRFHRKPPGPPQARRAKKAEVKLASELRTREMAECLTA